MKIFSKMLGGLFVCSVLLLCVCGCTEIPSSETENTTTPIVATTTATTKMTTTTTTVEKTTKATTTIQTSANAPTTKAATKAPVITTKKPTVAQTPGDGVTVYTTPKGKRYHYDPQCGGKNSGASSKDKAVNAGLTPCQKCAQ